MKKPFSLISKVLLVSVLAVFGATTTLAFSDLDATNPHYDSIEDLYTRKVVDGYGDGTFKPNSHINRAEFLKIVMAYFQSIAPDRVKIEGDNCFSDVHNEWFAAYVCGAHKMGVVDGYPDGTFNPGANISFVEASKILYNLIDFQQHKEAPANDPWFKKFVDFFAEAKAIPLAITGFDHLLTRGEMATFLMPTQKFVSTLTYDDLNAIGNLSAKANFVYRFEKYFGSPLSEDGVPDDVDYSTFQKLAMGTGGCDYSPSGECIKPTISTQLYGDKNRIYNYPPTEFKPQLIPLEGVDRASFEVHADIIETYASDKNGYYVADKANPLYHKTDEVPYGAQVEINKAKYNIVNESQIGLFVSDSDGFYFTTDDFKNPKKIESFNADDFQLIIDLGGIILFTDGENLYMLKLMKTYLHTIDDVVIKKLENVDLDSFKFLNIGGIVSYFKDKNAMYYLGFSKNSTADPFLNKIENIDLATLEFIKPEGGPGAEQYFKDKNGVYLGEYEKMVEIEGADKETFQVLYAFKASYKFSIDYALYYLRDANSVWIFNPEHKLQKIEGNFLGKEFDYKGYLEDKGIEMWQEI